MPKLYYAVVALKINEVSGVCDKLKEEGFKDLADWLDANKDDLYTKDRDEWNPFLDGIPIKNVLANDDLESSTDVIDELDDEISNDEKVKDVDHTIFFIDIFALFNKKFIKMANRFDRDLARSSMCCFVIPYSISEEFGRCLNRLLTEYIGRQWRIVYGNYHAGKPHRVIFMPDQIRNYIATLLSPKEKEDDIPVRQSKDKAAQTMQDSGANPYHTQQNPSQSIGG